MQIIHLADDNPTDDNQVYQKTKGRNYYERKRCVRVVTPGKEYEFVLRAVPIPEEITKLLESHAEEIKVLDNLDGELREKLTRKRTHDENNTMWQRRDTGINPETIKKLKELRRNITEQFNKTGKRTWMNTCDNIWSFGPRRNGCNLLINAVKDYPRPSIWSALFDNMYDKTYKEFDQSIVSGFQLATIAGPLCEEPLQGVAFIMEEWNKGTDEEDSKDSNESR